MRLSRNTLALGLAAAAAGGALAAVSPAHAAAPEPAYTCESAAPVPPMSPPRAAGRGCVASDGAPTSGPVEGPFRITTAEPPATFRCARGDAANYPEFVVGRECDWMPPAAAG